MKVLTTIVALCIGLTCASGANAALIASANGKTVYDTDLNVTWLTNANLAASNTFGLATGVDLGPIPGVTTFGSYIWGDGTMSWGGAMKWIGAMNAANYLGYNDWRLPSTASPITGWNSTGSEMSHLYYNELGNIAHTYCPGICGGLNAGPFTNLQPNYYWSGTEYASNHNLAWYFNMDEGNQSAPYKDSEFYALAVRSGQVVATPVPAAVWLLVSGLLGLIGVARRKA